MTPQPKKKQITLERTLRGTLEQVWELWTTKDGIESWWGPDGFRVEVRALELKPGGELHYAMIATAAPQIEFMKRAGMPLSTENRIRYTEILPRERLAYQNLADFIPGVAPYEVGTVLELEAKGEHVQLRLILDAMHDETWTGRMAMGWESELGKLERVLAA